MSQAEEAIAASFNYEALKTAYRQTREGIAVTLVLNPLHVPQELATAALGTRYFVVMVEIGDDEKPVNAAKELVRAALMATDNADRKRQIVVEMAKARYEASSEMERARTRSVLLAKSEHFIQWANKASDFIKVTDEASAAEYIREFCGVKSRAEIATDRNAYLAFNRLAQRYESQTGQMAEQTR